ncbi:MAG: exonuclease SbcCD subunit D C-terminal domain-containing protein [Desulfovibrionaceae bacterium]|nr:exonuclease SbcCD subunit D C-terminal domain-containing protein [Desulfovibrionaceae bacterium]
MANAHLRVLHTSDWHLGVSLHNQKRYDEFQAFFDWLIQTIKEKDIHVLLIAGDIFDTTTPSNHAQELYYQFLCQVVQTSCRHVVITGGNHDSPSFLNAPKDLLKAFSIHVVGQATNRIDDEVLLLKDKAGTPELVVLAVPYLRDRDIRLSSAGESSSDKEKKMLDGIKTHYAAVNDKATELLASQGLDLPIISMGHLFAAGGETIDGDGVRELYIGTLAHVNSTVFGQIPDYVALGHLHVPQKVQNQETIRYSGSPLPMGFGEAKQQKQVCFLEFSGKTPQISLIPVPKFKDLVSINGNWAEIKTQLQALIAKKSNALTEIIYDGHDDPGNLREEVEKIVAGSALEILRIKNACIAYAILRPTAKDETLDDLTVTEVFQRLLDLKGVPEDQQKELLLTYQEAVQDLQEKDAQAD